MSHLWKYTLLLLTLSVILVFTAAFSFTDGKLHLVFCDVGQGDAILIYKGSTQVLVDGGPDRKVLSCLSNHVLFWDRKLELVILTHSELDHYGGLVDVFRRYEVEMFAGSGVSKESEGYKVLEKEIEREGGEEIALVSGERIKVGGVTFDVLNPQKDVVAQLIARSGGYGSTEKVLGANDSLNEYSVVLGLKYGEFDALLTGDIEPPVTDVVAQELDGACHSPAPRPFHQVTTLGPLPWGSPSRATRPGSESGCIEVLKVPHHGSKNGLTQELLEAVQPEVAVILAGKKNRYGHPHASILDMLSNAQAKVLRTDVDGEIEVMTDGKKWELKKTN